MAEDILQHFRTAEKLNEEFKEELRKKQLHFRGNIGSFSLVSLDRNTPEQGEGGFVKCEQGRKCISEIDDILAVKKEKIDRGDSRRTREKELQAWIINYALNNNYTLPFSSGLQFLTSELAYPTPEKKIVNDVLAIDNEGTLVVIELKSLRRKKELEEQIKEFSDLIKAKNCFFKELVKLLASGKEWNGKVRKMIVWPDANGKSRNDWREGIEEVRYRERIGEEKRPEIDYDENGNIIFMQET